MNLAALDGPALRNRRRKKKYLLPRRSALGVRGEKPLQPKIPKSPRQALRTTPRNDARDESV